MNEGSGESSKSSELQFEKVELTSPTASRACPICQKVISDEYYEVAGNAICSSCAGSLGQGGGGSLARGFAFGAGAALVSSVIWYLIIKQWRVELGIIAIAVGVFVGIAVRNGARGAGGWRYQALAMTLTYFAIAGSQVPFVIDGLRQAQAEEQAKAGTPTATTTDEKPAAAASKLSAEAPSLGAYLVAWAFVLGIALVSPFFGGVQSIMGLVILGIALYEAWKFNRRVPVNGPFRLGSVPATT